MPLERTFYDFLFLSYCEYQNSDTQTQSDRKNKSENDFSLRIRHS